MSTYRLDLLFLDNLDAQLPTSPQAWVVVTAHSISSSKKFAGAPVISTEAVSITEFEYQIEALQKELDEIKTKARRKFQEATKRMDEKKLKRKS